MLAAKVAAPVLSNVDECDAGKSQSSTFSVSFCKYSTALLSDNEMATICFESKSKLEVER